MAAHRNRTKAQLKQTERKAFRWFDQGKSRADVRDKLDKDPELKGIKWQSVNSYYQKWLAVRQA